MGNRVCLGPYGLQNALGLRLTAHRSSNSSSLTAQSAEASEQDFYIDVVDYPFYKILASKGRTHGLDLSNESTAAGTTITVWQYQDSNPTPIHRQWMLFPLSATPSPDTIKEILATHDIVSFATDKHVYDLSGRRIDKSQLRKGIYTIGGKKVVIQ